MHGSTYSKPNIVPMDGATTGKQDIQSRFGQRLRTLRLKRGWTQKQMALELGFDRGHVCDLEHGKKSVTLRTMEVFARGLEVEVYELLRGI